MFLMAHRATLLVLKYLIMSKILGILTKIGEKDNFTKLLYSVKSSL